MFLFFIFRKLPIQEFHFSRILQETGLTNEQVKDWLKFHNMSTWALSMHLSPCLILYPLLSILVYRLVYPPRLRLLRYYQGYRPQESHRPD